MKSIKVVKESERRAGSRPFALYTESQSSGGVGGLEAIFCYGLGNPQKSLASFD